MCMLFTITTPILIHWHPHHSTEKVQLQMATCAWKLHTRRLSNEGCASFAWVSHRVDLNPANSVLWLCYMTTRLTLLDLYPSPLIIIILYSMKQLQVAQTLSFLNVLARIGKQNVIQYPGKTISILGTVGQ